MWKHRCCVSTGYNFAFITFAFLILIIIHFGVGVNVFESTEEQIEALPDDTGSARIWVIRKIENWIYAL